MDLTGLVPVVLALPVLVEAVEWIGRRNWRADALALTLRHGAALALAAVALVVTGRPMAALVLAPGVIMALRIGSAFKYTVLREPLAFTDLGQALKFFRFPAITIGNMTGRQQVVAVAVLAGLVLGLFASVTPAAGPRLAGATMLAGLWLVGARQAWRDRLTQALRRRFLPVDLAGQIAANGLLATTVGHFLLWRWTRPPKGVDAVAELRPDAPALVLVVQNESYCDPRELGFDHLGLPAFEALTGQALWHGSMVVSSIGANTIRTEAAVLTGLTAADLGVDGFDPYRRGEWLAPHSLARQLGARGYRTAFYHPFHRDFFRRSSVIPALGFERFVDREAFGTADHVGPHVGDLPLARRVLQDIAATDGPLFVMVATMENHGPWQPDRLEPGPGGSAQYLAHLRNGDRMLAELARGLAGEMRPWLLLFYGDHPPSLPDCPRLPAPVAPFIVLASAGERHGATGRGMTPAGLNALLRGLLFKS